MARKKTSSTLTSSPAQTLAPPASKVTSIESRSATQSPQPIGDAGHGVDEHIRRRAYELYEQRGRHDGAADQDWLRAEAELSSSSGKRRA